MRGFRHRLLFIALGCLSLFAVGSACGGDKPAPGTKPEAVSEAPSDPTPSQETIRFLRQSGNAALAATTFSGTYEIRMTIGGEVVRMHGEIRGRSPGDLYMTMRLSGDSLGEAGLDDANFEILLAASDIYMNIPEQCWFILEADAAGFNADQLEGMLEHRGVIDYSSITEGASASRDIGEEAINGVPHQHIQVKIDFADLANSQFAKSFLSGAAAEALDDLEGSGLVDTWINKETSLPSRVNGTMKMEIDGEDIDITMMMVFDSWDGPVEIPTAPGDARPISELE